MSGSEVWVFIAGEVPSRWLDRARPGSLVALLPEEADALLGHDDTETIDDHDRELAHLLARGLTVPAIARQLGVSPRSVDRRLASLRERLGVGSTPELALALARRGFGR